MKGLILNEPMVKAWLEGRKTVTRRLMKPQPTGHPWEYNPSHRLEHVMLPTNKGWYCKFWHRIVGNPHNDGEQWIRAPYRPGETVYIKETWAGDKVHELYDPWIIYYRADYDKNLQPENAGKWKSPRFMPEWASRSHALIKSVRPERIQEITEQEAIKEGVRLVSLDGCKIATKDYRTAFNWLWESLHPGSWERNDFVWRIELEKQ